MAALAAVALTVSPGSIPAPAVALDIRTALHTHTHKHLGVIRGITVRGWVCEGWKKQRVVQEYRWEVRTKIVWKTTVLLPLSQIPEVLLWLGLQAFRLALTSCYWWRLRAERERKRERHEKAAACDSSHLFRDWVKPSKRWTIAQATTQQAMMSPRYAVSKQFRFMAEGKQTHLGRILAGILHLNGCEEWVTQNVAK